MSDGGQGLGIGEESQVAVKRAGSGFGMQSPPMRARVVMRAHVRVLLEPLPEKVAAALHAAGDEESWKAMHDAVA